MVHVCRKLVRINQKKTYLGFSRCNRQKQLVNKAAINNYHIIPHDRFWVPLDTSTHQKEL